MIFRGPDLLKSVARIHCHSPDQKGPNTMCHEFFHWNLLLICPSSPKCLNSYVFSLPQVAELKAELRPCCIKLSRCIIFCRIRAKGSSYWCTNMSLLCMQYFLYASAALRFGHRHTARLGVCDCVRDMLLQIFLCKCKSVPESLLKLFGEEADCGLLSTRARFYFWFCIMNLETFVLKIKNIYVKISEVPLCFRTLHQLKSSFLFICITWSMIRKC